MAKLQSQISAAGSRLAEDHQEATAAVADEPLLGGMLHACVLHHGGLESALAYRLAQKLSSGEMSEQILREMADEAYLPNPPLARRRGPISWPSSTAIPPAIGFSSRSFTSRGSRRSRPIASVTGCGRKGRKDIAYFIQMRVSEVFGIDIHPAARIGKGIMIDHAHSIVIGETAVVGDNVSMLHSVTLGGTGKETEDRHPKIGDGVLIGAGAKVLGNIRWAIAAASPRVRWCWRRCRPARRWRAFRRASSARRVRSAVDEHGSSVRRQRLGS
jgi:serine O-acetyltransferase